MSKFKAVEGYSVVYMMSNGKGCISPIPIFIQAKSGKEAMEAIELVEEVYDKKIREVYLNDTDENWGFSGRQYFNEDTKPNTTMLVPIGDDY